MKRPRLRPATAWTLLLVCAALAAGGVLLLVAFSRNLARERRSAEGEAFAVGRRCAARAASIPADPSLGPLSPRLLPPAPPKDRALLPRGAAFLLGSRPLWADPGFVPPPLRAPAPGQDAAVFEGGKVYYLGSLEDGRLLVVAFDAPALEGARRRYTAALSLLLTALAVLLLLMAGFARELLWTYRQMEESLVDAGALLRPKAEGPAAGAAVELFRKTIEELRRRTAELEELHGRERARLEEVESLAEALSANLDAGYLRFDEEGRLRGVNGKARALLGLPEIPRLGDSQEALLAQRPEILELLEEARATRSLCLREELPGAPGVVLQAAGIPLFNLLHQRRGHLLLLRDQTAVVQLRKELREKETLSRLGEVAAGVAHEVRNSLGALLAHLRLLSEDHPGLEEDAHFRSLKEEAGRVEQVVRGLLEYSRPVPLVKEAVDLRTLLEREGDLVRRAGAGLSLEMEIPPGIRVEADPDALSRALRNLLRNAAEALEERGGGRIRLSARPAPPWVEITVEDDGPGLPPGDPEALFTPFSSQKAGGTGLGLALARKIAREHGGTLEAVSSTLGGAAFRLRLPGSPPGRPAESG
ncbi:MAG: sensor histidine kinase [Acidobacteriota bacterium]